MTDILKSEQHEKEQERFEKQQRRELNDIRKILSLAEGRRLLWRVMARAGTFSQSPSLEHADMAKEKGERLIGLFLLEQILKAKPEAFHQMQREHLSEVQSLKKERENERS